MGSAVVGELVKRNSDMRHPTLRSVLARGLLSAALLTAAACTPGRYTIDPDHTSIMFDVDHFKYTRFTIRFDRKQGRSTGMKAGSIKARRT
ncbi:MAG: Protein yceI precursor [uncultured Paraburkholderia sp.]|nr:MAG: Protein yceI precursor [uncultured Paraburkholderia sp.]CAH2942675.1 MAG: Protein yceI precursor [uncultured Paraburkholderia sp.]